MIDSDAVRDQFDALWAPLGVFVAYRLTHSSGAGSDAIGRHSRSRHPAMTDVASVLIEKESPGAMNALADLTP